MQEIERGTVTKSEFYFHTDAIITIEQGESLQIETDDALTGMSKNYSTTPTVHRMLNDPHVAGAEYPIDRLFPAL